MRSLLLVGVLLCAVQVRAGSPVEKVITMLEDLQTQVITEGKTEATTYDKFACFCKDMTDDKTEAINTGETNVESLTATMGALGSRRADLDTDIDDLNKDIADKHNQITEAKEKRAKEFAEYQAYMADLKDMEAELKGAKEALKNGMKGAALAQLTQKLQKVQVTLNQAPSAHMGEIAYQQHSAKLLKKVIEMEADTVRTIVEVEADEQKAQQDHDKKVLRLQLEIGSKEDAKSRTEERKADTSADLASTQQELTATLAQLSDDKAYIKDLVAKCEDKAKEYDQRSTMRSSELSALTQALTILGGAVSESHGKNTVRLVEKKATLSKTVLPEADEDEDEDEEDEAVSFLQEASSRSKLVQLATAVKTKGFLAPVDSSASTRDQLVELLRTKSTTLKSTALASLAVKAQADPFAKIKQLVDELINRLMQEAADEASHKGWCDKELTNAKQRRGENADSVRELNTKLEWGEAKRDKLAANIEKLEKELAELNASLDETTKQREEESAENQATVDEAKEGLEAINKAIDTLEKFYGDAKDAEVEGLVQVGAKRRHTGVDDDAPDTGFSGANKGSQGAAGGILAMMEVIQSDFERTIKETERTEKMAETDFLELEHTTKTSIEDKEGALEGAQSDHSATVDEIGSNLEDLKDKQALMDKALQELEELRPACIDTGMSYEERVAAREQEIEALNDALCIIDAGSAVQTEPACQK